MQPDQQQRIMGYFIEEAKDHLNTIEQGLLNLQSTIEDPEMANEVFRAAHSVKGGAAMLGLNGIQRVSHRLEDFFKVLKETRIQVDQKLENLFLRAFDALQELLGQLQGPFGLTEDVANQIVAAVEPTFVELEQHLHQLTGAPGATPVPTIPFTSGLHLDDPQPRLEAAVEQLFRTDVPLRLREMLQLFKQPDTDVVTRQQLQELCRSLSSLGEQYQLQTWCQLVDTARRAIAHPDNSYRILAPIVIRDIKLAQELVLAGRSTEISPCPQLCDLVPTPVPTETMVQEDLAELLGLDDINAVSADDLSGDPLDLTFDDLDATTEEVNLSGDLTTDLSEAGRGIRQGPEVGSAELNSLADLFEGEMPELGLTWQQEEVLTDEMELLTRDTGLPPTNEVSDFADLLFESTAPSPASSTAADDLSDLFGDDLDDDIPTQVIAAAAIPHVAHADDDFADLLGIMGEPAALPTDLDAADPFQTDATFNLESDVSDATAALSELDLSGLSDLELDGALGDLGDLFEGLNETDLPISEASPAPSVAVETDPWSAEIPVPSPEPATPDALAGANDLDLGDLDLGDLDLGDLESELVEDAIAEANLFPTDLNVVAPDSEMALNFADFALPDQATADLFSASTDSDDLEDLLNLDDESDLGADWSLSAADPDLDQLLVSDDPSASELSALGDFDAALFDSLEEPEPAPLHEPSPAVEFTAPAAPTSPDIADPWGDDFLESPSLIATELSPEPPVTATDEFRVDSDLNFADLDSAPAFDLAAAADAPDNAFDLEAPLDFGTADSSDSALSLEASFDFGTADSLDNELSLEDSFDFGTGDSPNSPDNSLGLEESLFSDLDLGSELDLNSESDLGAEPELGEVIDMTAELNLGSSDRADDDPLATDNDWFNDSPANPPEMLETWLQAPDVADLELPSADAELSDLNELLEIGAAAELSSDGTAAAALLDAATVPDAVAIAPDEAAALVDVNAAEWGELPELADLDNLDLDTSQALADLDNLDLDASNLEEMSLESGFAAANLTDIDAFDLPVVETSVERQLDAALESELGDLLEIPAISDELTEHSLDDLDQLLDDSSLESNAGQEFNDLEELLGAEQAPEFADFNGLMDEPVTPTFSTAQSFMGERPDFGSPDAEADEFSDLESLLAQDVLDQEDAPPTISNSMIDESEFDDLNDLLKDAEEKMGGSPTVKVGAGLTSGRRSPRPGRVFSEQTMRVPVKHLDNLSNLVGELVVNRNSLEQDQERLRQSLDNLLYQVQQLSDVGQRMQDLYERSLLESSLLASRQGYRSGSLSVRGDTTTVEAPTDHHSTVEYDPLEMDRFTGFHSLSQEMIELIVRVRESSSDIEFIVDETEQVTRMFRQVTTQLQEGLTRSRMVPFAQTADRLPRAVRDISMKVGKQAELIIEGRDTLIDKMILEQLYDPMTHLVNNAITHGIEDPAIRLAAGKPAVGRITIRAFHQGNQTIISVADDGAGIDVDRVKLKAVEKGLLTAEDARTISRLDMYDILFHPGFSTKDQADDFSGRGVGMDVVRTSLSEIRGVINTDSTPGRGTSFTIRLPLTLSISKALCCISDRARIAFPMDGVEDMLDVPKERLQTNADNQPCIAWRDTMLTVRPLSELLGYNRHLSRGNVYGGNQEDDMVSIVVLRSAGNFLALQVDQVMGEQEIVIKQLEGPVPKPIGVAGATVLGDGRIMPIADVLELIDLSVGRLRRDAGGSLWEQDGVTAIPEAPIAKTEPMVLIVDDSITVRELLSMTFNKVGYRVEQARDGQEAWEKLRSGLPCDIVFCDIEMPRMDGLELLSRIQKDINLKHLPIAMLTSRGADRHRQMAASLGASGYFTKPYLEEALLDAAQRMLKGERLLNNA